MESETLTLRGVTKGDRAAWAALWADYLAFYETTLPPEVYETSFANLLSDDPSTFQGRLAWLGKTPVGLVHWVYHPHMWRPEGTCYLQDLFTAPAARGRGVARALIEAVYSDADARGTPRVYWLTQEFNYAGRMLYDRIGTRTPFIRYDRPAV
ncbi:GNAT family N-acetyltransferase [Jannaschia sp. M317]|uniref:GNAT family N-acetyltransferase n=1 Tax=Jannaschia sp. M317 TaxID=2867011 RepID=UPI0021A48A7C|nr:GNAT family N-acetyltransferase [Jannaschia sp. M317]UWQ19344.1 GNAT family N-acetyltransferase [Jannaschia sp. M317]